MFPILVEEQGDAKMNAGKYPKHVADSSRKIMEEKLWADIEVYKFIKERFYLQLAEAREYKGNRMTTVDSCRRPNSTDMSPMEYALSVKDMLKGITWSDAQKSCLKETRDHSFCKSLI